MIDGYRDSPMRTMEETDCWDWRKLAMGRGAGREGWCLDRHLKDSFVGKKKPLLWFQRIDNKALNAASTQES